jgi:hypothetical protein
MLFGEHMAKPLHEATIAWFGGQPKLAPATTVFLATQTRVSNSALLVSLLPFVFNGRVVVVGASLTTIIAGYMLCFTITRQVTSDEHLPPSIRF